MQLSRRALLLASATLATVAQGAPKKQIGAARSVVGEILAAHAIPALSIAVMRNDELLWAEAFGKVDLELGVAATTAHRFRLGSVSKVFTATLAAQMAARGDIDLDAPVARYMPDLPPAHHATTLRQLLTHRGGIRHYAAKDESSEAPGNIDRRRYTNNADILAVFIDDPLIGKPGEQVSYSTFGYTLASIVLETAGKLSFLQLLKREIGLPLALSSLEGDAPMTIIDQRVSGYHAQKVDAGNQPGRWTNIAQNNPAYKWAGGGLLATPTDVARFGAAHLAPGKLSKAALDTLFTVNTARTERSPPLGLGWRIDEDAMKRPRWHHAGGQDGARSSLVVYPKERLSIAFATNVTQLPGDVNGPSSKIADAFAAV